MKDNRIIDTNVPLTAVTVDEAIPPRCIQACVRVMKRILQGEIVVVIDDRKEALKEYRQQMYPDPNPAAGLASQFLMYLFNHQFDESRVRRAQLSKDEAGVYATFPDDPELVKFDPSDKKWVAISVSFKQDTHEDAPINNATDSDWLHFEHVFDRLGIKIEFLCKDILKAED